MGGAGAVGSTAGTAAGSPGSTNTGVWAGGGTNTSTARAATGGATGTGGVGAVTAGRRDTTVASPIGGGLTDAGANGGDCVSGGLKSTSNCCGPIFAIGTAGGTHGGVGSSSGAVAGGGGATCGVGWADVDGEFPDGSEAGGSGTVWPPLAETRLGILLWIHPSIQVPRSVENSGVHKGIAEAD